MALNNSKDQFQSTKICGHYRLFVLWVDGDSLFLVLFMPLSTISSFGMDNHLGPAIKKHAISHVVGIIWYFITVEVLLV